MDRRGRLVSSLVQYPWRTRMGWECRGYMYYVDVCESECLDTARGLWLAGADYVSVYVRATSGEPTERWTYSPTHGAYRGSQMGGYSLKAGET